MGFDAIWISPVVDNYDNGYHGYWARNVYDVNGNFGSKDDLKNFVNACHAKNIWVMVDIVGNHVYFKKLINRWVTKTKTSVEMPHSTTIVIIMIVVIFRITTSKVII